ncbi:PEP-CTERM sorting domain-containing protein [Massilia forsythiae]|uniref:PEP-CTERM sorting domain-containing protein n=1 Tax=Massilia forsythiae TaxID=2728020 RepID=A0A7Z2VUE8_9BURK|nr:PEP-CTERM sorting domain-containing protein [Massilia forsythiae]QJD99312.1 PEP-CTERM sorting domain-containing protein [Massilia forsythiae]
MNLQSTFAAAILAAGAFTGAGPALAQSTPMPYVAGASVGNFSYRLVDLAPDDGIAPWIGVSPYTTSGYAHVYDQEGNHIDGADIDAPGDAGFANDYAAARFGIGAGATEASLSLYSGYAYASANQDFRFMLTPHTEVVFSADALVWAAHDPAAEHDTATAIAELFGSLRNVGDDDGLAFSTSSQVTQDTRAEWLSLSVHSGDDWAVGHVTMSAYGVAESHALPVPEPAMPAMLLGGMGLLAVAGRRYRK